MTTAGAEALEEWRRVAGRIERLHRLGRQRFDEDELLRLALQRLWIALGEAARRYCEAEGVGTGMPPWADMIGFRDKLAHLLETRDRAGGSLAVVSDAALLDLWLGSITAVEAAAIRAVSAGDRSSFIPRRMTSPPSCANATISPERPRAGVAGLTRCRPHLSSREWCAPIAGHDRRLGPRRRPPAAVR